MFHRHESVCQEREKSCLVWHFLSRWCREFEDLLNGNCSFQPSNYCLGISFSHLDVMSQTNPIPGVVLVPLECLHHNLKLTTRLVYLQTMLPNIHQNENLPKSFLSQLASSERSLTAHTRGTSVQPKTAFFYYNPLCCLGHPRWRMFKIQLNSSGLYMPHDHHLHIRKSKSHPQQICWLIRLSIHEKKLFQIQSPTLFIAHRGSSWLLRIYSPIFLVFSALFASSPSALVKRHHNQRL